MTPTTTDYHAPRLAVVRDEETDAQAAARLQRELDARVNKAVESLLLTLDTAEAHLRGIECLSAVKPGVRDECRQLIAKLVSSANTIASIQGRVG